MFRIRFIYTKKQIYVNYLNWIVRVKVGFVRAQLTGHKKVEFK